MVALNIKITNSWSLSVNDCLFVQCLSAAGAPSFGAALSLVKCYKYLPIQLNRVYNLFHSSSIHFVSQMLQHG